MIVSNLAVLLAERGIKITRLSSETGISRTTITALTQGNAQGIQLDTLNTLCMKLRVMPSDIFLTMPFDLNIKNVWVDTKEDSDYNEFDPNPEPPDEFEGGLTIELVDGSKIDSISLIIDGFPPVYEASDLVYYPSLNVDCGQIAYDTVKTHYASLPVLFRKAMERNMEFQIKQKMPRAIDCVRLCGQLDKVFGLCGEV